MSARARGAKLKAKGDVSGALEVLEEGLLTEPEDGVALHALIAQCHALRREWPLACRHFSSALDEAGEEALSTAAYRKVLDAEFYYTMGEACFRHQLHQQCLFAYESALELGAEPKATNMSSVHYQLGVTCRQLNEFERAVRSGRKRIRAKVRHNNYAGGGRKITHRPLLPLRLVPDTRKRKTPPARALQSPRRRSFPRPRPRLFEFLEVVKLTTMKRVKGDVQKIHTST